MSCPYCPQGSRAGESVGSKQDQNISEWDWWGTAGPYWSEEVISPREELAEDSQFGKREERNFGGKNLWVVFGYKLRHLQALLNRSIPLTSRLSVWLWASTFEQNKAENYTRGILKMGLTLHLSHVVVAKINKHPAFRGWERQQLVAHVVNPEVERIHRPVSTRNMSSGGQLHIFTLAKHISLCSSPVFASVNAVWHHPRAWWAAALPPQFNRATEWAMGWYTPFTLGRENEREDL